MRKHGLVNLACEQEPGTMSFRAIEFPLNPQKVFRQQRPSPEKGFRRCQACPEPARWLRVKWEDRHRDRKLRSAVRGRIILPCGKVDGWVLSPQSLQASCLAIRSRGCGNSRSASTSVYSHLFAASCWAFIVARFWYCPRVIGD